MGILRQIVSEKVWDVTEKGRKSWKGGRNTDTQKYMKTEVVNTLRRTSKQ